MRARHARAWLLAALVLAPATVAAAAPEELEAARAAQAEAARHYRESLQALLSLQEAALQRARTEAERRRALLGQELIAPADVAAAELVREQARSTVARTRTAIAEVETLVTEAEAAREIAALPAPAPGQTQERPSLIRYAGGRGWTAAALPAFEQFFRTRFGHPLPISALGQSAVHDRLGFDHRHALDVAVHPDSAEGRALMEYLRAHGIPFLAFRAARPGVATGAHVHVGEPSARLSSGSRMPGPVSWASGTAREAE